MPPSSPELPTPVIDSPAPYVAPAALAFGDSGQAPQFVTGQSPLPVALVSLDVPPSPLEGLLAESGTAGPFAAAIGRMLRVTLSGEWQGAVTVTRSTDGGATRLPLTVAGESWAVFTANVNEIIAEELEAGATYYLDFAHVSGALQYRMAQ